MPELSLVVCIHRQRELLQRLLHHAEGCFDELVVVHDGPDDSGVRSLVEDRYGGRFFERPRRFQQEPHWAFAWGQTRHDWILRWDADEFPDPALQEWLRAFRTQADPPEDVSGFTFIHPLWDGSRARTSRWPRRIALIDRRRVRHIGMADQAPIPDGRLVELDLVLHHQPPNATYGVRYTIANTKVRRWHEEIARSLLGKPTDLPCWRWDKPEWPDKWEQIRRRPLLTALARLVLSPLWNAREMIAYREPLRPSCLTTFPLQHWMTCLAYMRMRRENKGAIAATAAAPAQPAAKPTEPIPHAAPARDSK
jgi:hypothetical protein